MHLTIGITGHKNLVIGEETALKKSVRSFFLELSLEFPDLDLQLISPLAEGSDQLAAEVALELGIGLIVPLPMPQPDYEQDFSSPAAVETFRETLKAATVVQLKTLPEVSGDTLSTADRARQYAQLCVFLSNHSQILLALWDGKPSTAPGGTASVVNYHLTAVLPGFSIAEESPNLLADNENDLAYHIVCSRDQADGAPREGLKSLEASWVSAHYGKESGAHMPFKYQAMLKRLQDYGRDKVRHQVEIERQGNDLFEEAPELRYPPGAEAVSKEHSAADWLALHFQKRVHGALRATHGVAILMGLIFLAYSEFTGMEYLLPLFLMTFAAGFAVYKIGERRQWHRKYLDYRALAEGLRVQFYWNLAGVIDLQSAEFAYDNFLQKQDVDLGWIRHVMRNMSLSRSRNQLPSPDWLAWVIEHWIGSESRRTGQLSYYKEKEVEKAKHFKRTSFLGRIALWAGIAVAGSLIVIGKDISTIQRHVLLVMMAIFPLIAGVRDAYSHKKAEKELIKQYNFMYGILSNAKRLLDSSDDLKFRRGVLRALGNAALEEDAEWILIHRERPLEHSGL